MSGGKVIFPHWKQSTTSHQDCGDLQPGSQVPLASSCHLRAAWLRRSVERAHHSLGRWPKSCFSCQRCRALRRLCAAFPLSPSVRCSGRLSPPAGTMGQPRGILSDWSNPTAPRSPGLRRIPPCRRTACRGTSSRTSITHAYPHGCTQAQYRWKNSALLSSSHSTLQVLTSAHVQQERLWPNSTQVSQRSCKNSRFVGLRTAQSRGKKMEQECFRDEWQRVTMVGYFVPLAPSYRPWVSWDAPWVDVILPSQTMAKLLRCKFAAVVEKKTQDLCLVWLPKVN